jgi:hypothetical protein
MVDPADPCFGHMDSLLREWMHGARLLEITSVVQLAKLELARRGITLTWSVTQTDPPSTRQDG